MKRTINELAAYFDLPYQVIHKVVFPIKKFPNVLFTHTADMIASHIYDR